MHTFLRWFKHINTVYVNRNTQRELNDKPKQPRSVTWLQYDLCYPCLSRLILKINRTFSSGNALPGSTALLRMNPSSKLSLNRLLLIKRTRKQYLNSKTSFKV